MVCSTCGEMFMCTTSPWILLYLPFSQSMVATLLGNR
uniref:Uncharacterized protein n=1 Tax=Rhizophora mucronata TaxID=61149 RepID=A0A2P2Q9W3_RHIMU